MYMHMHMHMHMHMYMHTYTAWHIVNCGVPLSTYSNISELQFTLEDSSLELVPRPLSVFFTCKKKKIGEPGDEARKAQRCS